MSNYNVKVKSKAGAIPFPDRRETSAKLRELNKDLRSLREKVEIGENAASVARSAALLYVDLIARIHTFSEQLDLALGYQFFVPDWTLKENLERGRAALSMYARLTGMMCEAIEGLFRCLGGQSVLSLQALAAWIGQHPELRTLYPALGAEIHGLAKGLGGRGS